MRNYKEERSIIDLEWQRGDFLQKISLYDGQISQMKLQMKREALEKLNRRANETGAGFGTVKVN